MKERSATLALPPTRYDPWWAEAEAEAERAFSSTPRTRTISFWYRSIALGSFSLAKSRNHPAWPKYGLWSASVEGVSEGGSG